MKKSKIGIGIILLLIIFYVNIFKYSPNGYIISRDISSVNFFNLILMVLGFIFIISGGLEKKFEIKKNYGGVIIFRGNWRGYPFEFKQIKRKGESFLDISTRSKMNCLAASQMYLDGLTKKIIIGAGQSAEKKWPSEASTMKNYILKRFKEKINPKDILIQERTLDTYEGIDEDLNLAKKHKIYDLALVIVNTQLPRCKKYLEDKGQKLDCFSSESIIKNCSKRHSLIVDRYEHSLGVKYYEKAKEFALRTLQNLGITNKFTKTLAKIVRK